MEGKLIFVDENDTQLGEIGKLEVHQKELLHRAVSVFIFNKNNKLIILAMLVLITSCASMPKGVTAVSPFEKEKYPGKWYEIARFDFRIERGLNNTNQGTIEKNENMSMINNEFIRNRIWQLPIWRTIYDKSETS